MGSREGVLGGGALAVAGDLMLRRRTPRARLALQGAGLVAAAVVYPALHNGRPDPAEQRREMVGIVAAGAIVVTALVARRTKGRQLLALGWAAHALFDAGHHRGETSLVPDWYPAVCAGYDLTTAVAILAPIR